MLEGIIDIIKTAFSGGMITAVGALIVFFLKKGQFESWGIAVGKALSKFASAKFGKAAWEKLEDTITVSFVSFAKGLKEGADADDEGNT
jgi:hypothetical protein